MQVVVEHSSSAMWFAEDSSPENEHVTNLIEQLGTQNYSLRSQIVLMIRHLCVSYGLEVPVELATIDFPGRCR